MTFNLTAIYPKLIEIEAGHLRGGLPCTTYKETNQYIEHKNLFNNN